MKPVSLRIGFSSKKFAISFDLTVYSFISSFWLTYWPTKYPTIVEPCVTTEEIKKSLNGLPFSTEYSSDVNFNNFM